MQYRGTHSQMAIVPRATPLRIGSITIQPVSDGILRLDPSSIFKDAQPEEWQPYVSLDEHGRTELALNCLLLRVGERCILVDTGFGPRPDGPELGQLFGSLAEVGVSREHVDTVVISHPHGDHIGGAVLGNGDATSLAYPAARYWLSRADWDHFTEPQTLARGALQDKLPPLERAQRLELADGEQEIAPGVRLLPLPGHTPGHMGVALTDGQETA